MFERGIQELRRDPLSALIGRDDEAHDRASIGGAIAGILRTSGIGGPSLKVEITESALMEKSDKALSMLAAIRALHIDIQIDDFGTGYSSLSYLRLFPVSAVKVDRSFVTGMDTDQDHAAMVSAISTLAHNLDLAVIAEGIETAEELEALRGLSCEYGQGFLLSAPLAVEAACALIASTGKRVAAA